MGHTTLNAALLKPLYTQTVREWPFLGTPVAVAARFEDASKSRAEVADQMVEFYLSLCGTAGFLYGVPGLAAMPLTLPANIVSLAFLQLHMCAALATLSGFGPRSATVREMSVRCLLGDSKATRERDELEGIAKRVATKVAERGVRVATEQIFKGASQMVLRRLPFVGGAVGCTSDILTTRQVAAAARRAFLDSTPTFVEGEDTTKDDALNER